MKKHLLIILLLALSMSMAFASGEKETMNDSEMMMDDSEIMLNDYNQVAVIMDAGKGSKNVKYIYDALKNGIKAAGYEEEVTIDFIATTDAVAELFNNYAVVVVVNEDTTDALSPDIAAFLEEYKSKTNLIATAIVPGAPTLATLPSDIDVMTAPSTKADAGGLMYGKVSPLVADLLDCGCEIEE